MTWKVTVLLRELRWGYPTRVGLVMMRLYIFEYWGCGGRGVAGRVVLAVLLPLG